MSGSSPEVPSSTPSTVTVFSSPEPSYAYRGCAALASPTTRPVAPTRYTGRCACAGGGYWLEVGRRRRGPEEPLPIKPQRRLRPSCYDIDATSLRFGFLGSCVPPAMPLRVWIPLQPLQSSLFHLAILTGREDLTILPAP